MNVEELVVYCRDLLCAYISDTQCCFGVGCLRAVWGEPSAFISAPQTRSPKLVLGELLLKNQTVNWPGYGLLQLNLKH